jgi:hypothetical protein
LANRPADEQFQSRAARMPPSRRTQAMSRFDEKNTKWLFDTLSPEVSGESAKLFIRFRILSMLGLVLAVFAAAALV